jgi:hypothetical protein
VSSFTFRGHIHQTKRVSFKDIRSSIVNNHVGCKFCKSTVKPLSQLPKILFILPVSSNSVIKYINAIVGVYCNINSLSSVIVMRIYIRIKHINYKQVRIIPFQLVSLRRGRSRSNSIIPRVHFLGEHPDQLSSPS